MTLHPRLAAEVSGAALTDPDAVHSALLEHPVLVIRDQELGPAELTDLGLLLSSSGRLVHGRGVPGFPAVSEVSNQRSGRAVPPYWHTDGSLDPDGAELSLFHAVQAPAQGGETLFLDARRAFDTLPAEDRRLVQQRAAVMITGAERPMVRRHPHSGRIAMWIDMARTAGIEGLDRPDAVEALRRLRDHYDAEPHYSHAYRRGDLLIWDNGSVAHSATPPPPEGDRRVLLHLKVAATA